VLVIARLRLKPLAMAPDEPEGRWLAAFHAGDGKVIERCYRDHYKTVAVAVGRLLSQADAETVTHEVFYRLLSSQEFREHFDGGSFVAWLTRVATNSALDYRRRYGREQGHPPEGSEPPQDAGATAERLDDELEAKRLIEQFCRECLPPEWRPVFDARFLRHLPQRAAAAAIGMRRTTLAYQEGRIRALLEQFLLRRERR
jgi:RNA polymerase sigma-70 factor (ECF subfamily)